MVVIYRCSKCGYDIYRFRVGKDSFGLPTPSELRIRVADKCPQCGKPLGNPRLNDVLILKAGEGRKKK
jgi:rubredoxin